MVPVVEHGVLVVLVAHCPVEEQLEDIAALAGSVAASLRLTPLGQEVTR